MEAMYYTPVRDQIRCELCPHQCIIGEGHSGICRVRRNEGGRLMADSYGKLSSIHLDPIEKKPLYHFHSGKNILSLGSVGCNMHCGCCQNWQISQVSADEFSFGKNWTPSEIMDLAEGQRHNVGVAYTYNEPSVGFEFMVETARMVHERGLKNVMVSNGYISPVPLQELLRWVDAFNIDLKSFSEEAYRKFTGARLAPVLETLRQIRQTGRHLEITCLVIPDLNDDENEFGEMIRWIVRELGNDTVLHLSRYHPAYKLRTNATGENLLNRLYSIAREKMPYVYVGNLMSDEMQDTYCRGCGEKVIVRRGYQVDFLSITPKGNCRRCGTQVVNND